MKPNFMNSMDNFDGNHIEFNLENSPKEQLLPEECTTPDALHKAMMVLPNGERLKYLKEFVYSDHTQGSASYLYKLKIQTIREEMIKELGTFQAIQTQVHGVLNSIKDDPTNYSQFGKELLKFRVDLDRMKEVASDAISNVSLFVLRGTETHTVLEEFSNTLNTIWNNVENMYEELKPYVHALEVNGYLVPLQLETKTLLDLLIQDFTQLNKQIGAVRAVGEKIEKMNDTKIVELLGDPDHEEMRRDINANYEKLGSLVGILVQRKTFFYKDPLSSNEIKKKNEVDQRIEESAKAVKESLMVEELQSFPGLPLRQNNAQKDVVTSQEERPSQPRADQPKEQSPEVAQWIHTLETTDFKKVLENEGYTNNGIEEANIDSIFHAALREDPIKIYPPKPTTEADIQKLPETREEKIARIQEEQAKRREEQERQRLEEEKRRLAQEEGLRKLDEHIAKEEENLEDMLALQQALAGCDLDTSGIDAKIEEAKKREEEEVAQQGGDYDIFFGEENTLEDMQDLQNALAGFGLDTSGIEEKIEKTKAKETTDTIKEADGKSAVGVTEATTEKEEVVKIEENKEVKDEAIEPHIEMPKKKSFFGKMKEKFAGLFSRKKKSTDTVPAMTEGSEPESSTASTGQNLHLRFRQERKLTQEELKNKKEYEETMRALKEIEHLFHHEKLTVAWLRANYKALIAGLDHSLESGRVRDSYIHLGDKKKFYLGMVYTLLASEKNVGHELTDIERDTAAQRAKLCLGDMNRATLLNMKMRLDARNFITRAKDYLKYSV